MSGFEPIMMIAGQGLGMVNSAIKSNQQARYQQAMYAQQQAQAQAQAASQLAQLQAAHDADAENRRRQLKAQLASQKASFGASGIETASGGSANAVLNGLVSTAAQDQATQDNAYSLKAASIGQNYDFASQKNLLEQQRQFVGSSNGLGLLSRGVGMAGGLMNSLL